MGDKPFKDGEDPREHGHGAADEEFASVVFDEAFVRSARIHEPTAVERMLAAAEARAEAEATARGGGAAGPSEDDFPEDVYGPFGAEPGMAYGESGSEEDGPYGPYGGAFRPYRGQVRWHRPVAWVLALVMGIGMIALAFAAIYRDDTDSRRNPDPPPASSDVDGRSADRSAGTPRRPGSGPADVAGGPEAVPSVPAAVGH